VSWVALVLIVLIGAMASVLLPCLVAWFILSRWLEGRSLIIASVACAIAAGLGRSSDVGPANAGALLAVLSAAGTILVGLFVAKVWLARWKGQFDG
jgi:hypothetical protein